MAIITRWLKFRKAEIAADWQDMHYRCAVWLVCHTVVMAAIAAYLG